MTRASRVARPRVILAGWTAAVLAFLYLPVVVLAVYSFNASRLNIAWGGFTLRWYAELRRNGPLLEALGNSLLLASAATVVALVLGAGAAWLTHRHRYRGGGAIDALVLTPLLMPEVITGVSLLLCFAAVGWPLGFSTLLVAHATFCIPFVMLVVRARLAGLDPALEEAALDLGATPARAFLRVILPQLRPALLSAALLSFALSMDELIISYFVYAPDAVTLPIKVYGMARVGLSPVLNALSTVFLVVTALLVSGALRAGRDWRSP